VQGVSDKPEYTSTFDAESSHGLEHCPECDSDNTITYHYNEGFTELECLNCGYLSDAEEIAALTRYDGSLIESDKTIKLPMPVKKIKA